MDRAKFESLISRDDAVGMHAVGRALVHLFRRQTADEQQHNSTKHTNHRGFTGADAHVGSITAKYYIKHGTLQDWQLKQWRKPNRRGVARLAKYYRQVAEEAQNRVAQKSWQQMPAAWSYTR